MLNRLPNSEDRLVLQKQLTNTTIAPEGEGKTLLMEGGFWIHSEFSNCFCFILFSKRDPVNSKKQHVNCACLKHAEWSHMGWKELLAVRAWPMLCDGRGWEGAEWKHKRDTGVPRVKRMVGSMSWKRVRSAFPSRWQLAYPQCFKRGWKRRLAGEWKGKSGRRKGTVTERRVTPSSGTGRADSGDPAFPGPQTSEALGQ